MSRRKKRGPGVSQTKNRKAQGEDAKDGSAQPEQRSIPQARPPRKNRVLLLFCAALFALWLAALVALAVSSN